MISLILMVIAGLITLWISGELVVRYSLQLAYITSISTLYIGFFFISISTGLPELFIVINATLLKTPALAVGNIMGSNFFNIVMALGIPVVFIRPLMIQKDEFTRTLYLLMSTLALILYIFSHQKLYMLQGITLMIMYAAVNLLSFRLRGQNNAHADSMPHVKAAMKQEPFLTSAWGTIFKLLVCVISVITAAHITVTYAIKLAQALGFPLSHFGATFVALGTSLPELTLGITAAKNKEYALAIGNAFGSIWGQGAFMLGILTILNEPSIDLGPISHLLPFLVIAFVIVGCAIIQKKRIGKTAGLLLICTYLAFVIYEFFDLSS